MVKFKVLLDNSTEAVNYMSVVSKKLESNNMVDNPFTATVKHIGFEWLIDINPIYPNYSIMGIIPFGIGLFTGIKFLIFVGLLILVTHIFFTSLFYFVVIKTQLKRSGYKGYVGYRKYGSN